MDLHYKQEATVGALVLVGALLFIGGGSNRDAAPAKISDRLVNFAMETNTPVAELGMVPNQPLAFGRDGPERKEDDLIEIGRASCRERV